MCRGAKNCPERLSRDIRIDTVTQTAVTDRQNVRVSGFCFCGAYKIRGTVWQGRYFILFMLQGWQAVSKTIFKQA